MNLISKKPPPRQPLKILHTQASNKNPSGFPSRFKVEDGIKTTTGPEATNRGVCCRSDGTLRFHNEAFFLSWHLFEVCQSFDK